MKPVPEEYRYGQHRTRDFVDYFHCYDERVALFTGSRADPQEIVRASPASSLSRSIDHQLMFGVCLIFWPC